MRYAPHAASLSRPLRGAMIVALSAYLWFIATGCAPQVVPAQNSESALQVVLGQDSGSAPRLDQTRRAQQGRRLLRSRAEPAGAQTGAQPIGSQPNETEPRSQRIGALPVSTLLLEQPAAAQPAEEQPTGTQPVEVNTSAPDTPQDYSLFYAYLQDNPNEPAGPFYEFFKEKPVFKDVLIPRNNADRKFRPMLQMRFWWDQPQRFPAAVAFCTFVAWIFWFLVPEKLSQAQAAIRSGFWRCALTGFFCGTVWMLFSRAVFLTHVGWPLGIVSTGLFQATLLLGLSVIISMIGHALAVLLKLRNIPFLGTRPEVMRIVELLLGSTICGLILLLPSPALMPHATMRLLFLFAVLGMGAVFKVSRQQPEPPAGQSAP